MQHSDAEAIRDRAPRHRELWQNVLLACASLLVQQRRVHFEHEEDWHWNAAGHRLATDVLVNLLAPRCGEMTSRAAPPSANS
jgi:hypothetical protein